MAFICFASFYLPGAGHFKTLGGSSVGFKLGHFISPFMRNNAARYYAYLFAAGGYHHGDMITFQPWLLFNIKFTGKQLSNSIKYFHTHLRSNDFPSPEK